MGNNDFKIIINALLNDSSLTDIEKKLAKKKINVGLDINFANSVKKSEEEIKALADKFKGMFDFLKNDNQAMAFTKKYLAEANKLIVENAKAEKAKQKELERNIELYNKEQQARERAEKVDIKTRTSNANSILSDEIASLNKIADLRAKIVAQKSTGNESQVSVLREQLSLEQKHYNSLSTESSRYADIISNEERRKVLKQETLSAELKVKQAEAKVSDNTMSQAEKAKTSELQTQANLIAKIKESQSVGSIDTKIASTSANFEKYEKLGLITDELRTKFTNLKSAQETFNSSSDDKLITNYNKLNSQVLTVDNSLKQLGITEQSSEKMASQIQIDTKIVQINEQIRKNGGYTKEAKQELQGFVTELKNVGATQGRLSEISLRTKQIGSEMAIAGHAGRSLTESIKEQASKFTQWISASAAVMKGVQAFKQMVSNTYELDDALANINYTMDVSTSQLQHIGEESLNTAERLKTSTSNVLNAVKLYANANETADSILEKAQTSVMLSNVTGISTTDTSKTLQAIMNQFDLDISQIQHVSDVLQGVSAGMAWDFSDGIVQISDAIKMSGSVAKDAGLDIENYSALIGKLVESTGLGGSQIGTAMRTMFTRITKASATGEASDEDISKAETALKNVGVEVRSDINTFRDMNDILGDLASKWETLLDTQKNAISYQVAGTRQTSIFKTLMKDFSGYKVLVDKANNSEGITLENQKKYSETLKGKLNDVKAIWENIGNDTLKSGFLKGLTDAGVSASKLVEKVGLLRTAMLGIGAYAGIKNVGKAYKCMFSKSIVLICPLYLQR